jgi:hypothetical protein
LLPLVHISNQTRVAGGPATQLHVKSA